MSRPSGLGRGLGALIPAQLMTDAGSELREISLAAVVPNRHQPRTHFDEDSLLALSESIRELGVLQPILVRPFPDAGSLDDEQFELIAGERRWRAAKRAGLDTIPAIVRPVADLVSLEQALVENLHREDLNPLEEAAAYQQLIEDFRLTQEDLATRVGRSRSAIANMLRLFQLSPGIQRMVGDRRLTAGHARALLGTPDRSFQEALADRVCREGLSVRQTEEAVRRRAELHAKLGGLDVVAPATADGAGQGPPRAWRDDGSAVDGGGGRSGSHRDDRDLVGGTGWEGGSDDHVEAEVPSPVRPLPPAGVVELEEVLGNYLDTKVQINLGRTRGRISIDFADLADLERIYRLMADPSV